MESEMNLKDTQYIDATLQLHGLALDESCRAEVINQFSLLKIMIKIVETEALSAEIESANTFRL